MLARASLRDDALLAHAHGEQCLADGVVQLVRPGVAQVLALEMDVRATEVLAQAARGIKRRRASDKGTPVARQLELELRVGLHLVPHVFELPERAHQGLRHVLPAKRAEPAVDGVSEG